MSSNRQTLAKVLARDQIITSKSKLAEYRYDLSTLSRISSLGNVPDVLVLPRTTKDVSQLVTLANRGDLSIAIYGGASNVIGATLSSEGVVALDMRQMNKIIELNPHDMYVHVQAGILGGKLEQYLNRSGFTTGHLPQSLYVSTVGGWLSTRSSGALYNGYGAINRMLLGMEVVLPTGEIMTFEPRPDWSAGPDPTGLFVGSLGTIGIITQAWLKIAKLPKKRLILSYQIPSFEAGLALIKEGLLALSPSAVRLYDSEESHRLAPTMSTRGHLLLVMLEGGDDDDAGDSVSDMKYRIQKRVKVAGGAYVGGEPGSKWLEERYKAVEIRRSILYKSGIYDSIEISSRWSKALLLYRELSELSRRWLAEEGIELSFHASRFSSNFVGMVGLITAASTKKKKTDRAKEYEAIWNDLFGVAKATGAHISLHHAYGRFYKLWAEDKGTRASVDVFNKVRACLDAHGILNRSVLRE